MKNLKLENKQQVIEFIANEFFEKRGIHFDYIVEDLIECKKFICIEDNIESREKEYSEEFTKANIYNFLRSELRVLKNHEVITIELFEETLEEIRKKEVIEYARSKTLNGFDSVEHLITELKKHFNLINEEVVEETKEEVKQLNNNEKLANLINEIRNNKTDGVITFEDGKTYTKVDYRLRKAREVFGFDINIITNIISNTGHEVVMRAEIQFYDTRLNCFRTVATGTSSEARDKSVFNRFSYIEIAETSAIGRALANLGLFGNEYASANEITVAKTQQEAAKTETKENKLITKTSKKAEPEIKVNNNPISSIELQHLQQLLKKSQIEEILVLQQFNKGDLKDLTKDEYKLALQKIQYIQDEECPI